MADFQENTLYATDVYKLGHMEQYAPGTDKVYGYLCARSDRYYKDLVFFGLQYYLRRYLSRPVTKSNVNQFMKTRRRILGTSAAGVEKKLMSLVELGYWPLEIRALPEGTVVPAKNALYTVESTLPEFYWAPGYLESLMLKVWYPTTVATNVYKYRRLIERFCSETTDAQMRDFLVHDFGYRSDSSEESAAISGAAFLISFCGSDTVPATPFIDEFYGPVNDDYLLMMSVPASEHSVMCSYGPGGEFDAYERLLELYPSGIVSIVSDTYDIYRVCTEYLPRLKDRILARNGKVVIRPDSGNPPDIICGDPERPENSPEQLGVLRLLDKEFGHSVNKAGYKELHPNIGLIYGDGMYYERYENTLERMKKMKYAANNLVIGIGGIARQGTRDTLGMAQKATYIEVNGQPRDILKSPITDPGKKSHTGRFQVYRDADRLICTRDQASREQVAASLLQTVFYNGRLTNPTTFPQVRSYFDATRDH